MCMCTVHLEQGCNMDSALFVPCYSIIQKWMKLFFLHTIPPNDKVKKFAWIFFFSSFKCIKYKKQKYNMYITSHSFCPILCWNTFDCRFQNLSSSIRFDGEHYHQEVKIKDGTAHCCIHFSCCWKTFILTRWAVLLYFRVLQKWLSFRKILLAQQSNAGPLSE